MQVYDKLDILTNKPKRKFIDRYDCKLFNFLPYPEKCNVGLWRRKSIELLNERGSLKGNILPKDISELLFFLSSDKSKHISGQIIRVDKGMPF